MASNCSPSSVICSGVNLASGLSMRVSLTPSLLRSEVDLDGTLGRADARPDRLPFGPVELSVSQVPHTARAERADAGVADALATAEGQVEAALLAGHEDRGAAVRLGLGVAGEEADLA